MHYKISWRYFLLIFVMVGLTSTMIKAKQLNFNKQKIDNGYAFSYQWLDHDNTKQALKFTLNNDALFERFRSFKTYKPFFAQKSIYRSIKIQLQKESLPEGIQVNFYQKNDEIKINIKGKSNDDVNQAYTKILALKKQMTDQYFRQNYYHAFINHDQIMGIKVNHTDIANAAVSDLKSLKPLILETVSIQNVREVVNFILGFIQSIPYSPLESRITSSGAGFNPPLTLLWENQGDCDSKMTLAATLFRALMPRIKMALITIDNHAFIGLNIPVKDKDLSVVHQGIRYILAEPTGPALLKLGVLAAESKLAIDQGRYVIEAFHEKTIKK